LLEKFNVIAKELSSSAEHRGTWIELNSAIYQALPRDSKIQASLTDNPGVGSIDPKDFPFAGREEIYIDHIETVFHKDLGEWKTRIAKIYENQGARTTANFGADEPAADDAAAAAPAPDPVASEEGTGLTGTPGWVIEIQAHHFHNEDAMNSEIDYIRSTLLNQLMNGSVELPEGQFTYQDIGISFPTITRVSERSSQHYIYLETADDEGSSNRGARGNRGSTRRRAGAPVQQRQTSQRRGGIGLGGPGGLEENPADGEDVFEAQVFAFVIQMAWTPRSVNERLEARKKRLAAEAKRLNKTNRIGFAGEHNGSIKTRHRLVQEKRLLDWLLFSFGSDDRSLVCHFSRTSR